MEFASIHSPEAAFVAGLATSLHCAGMCGPIGCAIMPVRGDRADVHVVSSAYHAARLAAYTFLGALAGGLGMVPLGLISQSALRWLPWGLVLLFVALALRWDRLIPKSRGLGGFAWRLAARLSRRSHVRAAAVLGVATPILPCGPLYFLVALALLSGSALHGAEFMLAFGLGTVPLLWLAQSQMRRIREVLPARWIDRSRTVLGLTAAAVIAWRLRGTLGFSGPDPASLVCF